MADHEAPLVSSPQTEQLKAAKLRKKLEKQNEARQKKGTAFFRGYDVNNMLINFLSESWRAGVVYVSRVPPHMVSALPVSVI